MSSRTTCRIEVLCLQVAPGQLLAVSGSSQSLGAWDPKRAIQLTTTATAQGVWSGTIPNPKAGVEFKFLILGAHDGRIVEWEPLRQNRQWPAGAVGAGARMRATFGKAGVKIDEGTQGGWLSALFGCCLTPEEDKQELDLADPPPPPGTAGGRAPQSDPEAMAAVRAALAVPGSNQTTANAGGVNPASRLRPGSGAASTGVQFTQMPEPKRAPAATQMQNTSQDNPPAAAQESPWIRHASKASPPAAAQASPWMRHASQASPSMASSGESGPWLGAKQQATSGLPHVEEEAHAATSEHGLPHVEEEEEEEEDTAEVEAAVLHKQIAAAAPAPEAKASAPAALAAALVPAAPAPAARETTPAPQEIPMVLAVAAPCAAQFDEQPHFLLPSVGTWLHAPRRKVVMEADAIFASKEMQDVRAPLPAPSKCDAELPESPIKRQADKLETSLQPERKWSQLPSVGTWYHAHSYDILEPTP